MINIYLTLILSLFTVCDQNDLEFYKEKITIQIDGYACTLIGEYWFRNLFDYPLARMLSYPISANNHLQPANKIQITNISEKKSVKYNRAKEGIYYFLKISPRDSLLLRVEYHQKTPEHIFEYILKSTRAWQRPLRDAEYIVKVPKTCKLKSISIPYNHVKQDHYYLFYLIERKDFLPDKNLVISWEMGDETNY